jgi:hypothetical protein
LLRSHIHYLRTQRFHLCVTQIFYLRMTHTNYLRTQQILYFHKLQILHPLIPQSVYPPHDTIFGPVPLRQPVVSFNFPLTHSDPEVSVDVELTSIQPPASGCTPVRSPPLSTPIEVDRLPRMNTADSSAPPYHGPHILKVGSANYAPELGANSRTIRVYGPSVGAVDIGDDVSRGQRCVCELYQRCHL